MEYGYMSGTLQFLNILAVKDKGKVKQVGVELVSGLDITVPQIPFIYTSEYIPTIPNMNEVSSRVVKAGERFTLSLIEFVMLITKEEYAGCCQAKGYNDGCKLYTDIIHAIPLNKVKVRVGYKRGLGSIKEQTVVIGEVEGESINVYPQYKWVSFTNKPIYNG